MKEVKGRLNEPIARLTPLGWTCVGKVSTERSHKRSNFMMCFFTGERQHKSQESSEASRFRAHNRERQFRKDRVKGEYYI